MITGLNHLTIAVTDLEISFKFYVDVLGFKPSAKWNEGAYLSAGDLWLCLSLGPVSPSKDYTHFAFSSDESSFTDLVKRIKASGATCWKKNSSEGDSYYFLDPDSHKLELHTGNLRSRTDSVDSNPYAGWKRL